MTQVHETRATSSFHEELNEVRKLALLHNALCICFSDWDYDFKKESEMQ